MHKYNIYKFINLNNKFCTFKNLNLFSLFRDKSENYKHKHNKHKEIDHGLCEYQDG